MRHLLAVILLLVVGSAHAATVTIDFEGLANTDPLEDQSVIVPQGFIFTAINTLGLISGGKYSVCTTAEGLCSAQSPYGSGFTFTQEFGGLFSLASMDLILTDDYCVSFWGNNARVDLADSIPPGYVGCAGDFENGVFLEAGTHNIVFGEEWGSLSDVYIHTHDVGSAMSVDNIVVNVVPIPAAVWLFGSGLSLLGWFRRKGAAS